MLRQALLLLSAACAANALVLTPRAAAAARVAPSCARVGPVRAADDENEMEPDGGWNIDNLMDMMDTADEAVSDEAVAVKAPGAGEGENEMEPEEGWNVDNLMDMMGAADDAIE